MKVFGCEMQGSYRGGIILVAANNVEEAFLLASNYAKCDYMFEWETPDGDWAEPNSEGAVLVSDYYPIECWYEFEHLSYDCIEPQVILEEGHAE